MEVTESSFGFVDGLRVQLYELRNENGLRAKISNYGAILTEFWAPDRQGRFDDLVLGYDSLPEYLRDNPYFGAMVGRCSNRIAGAEFELDGRHHQLAANNGPHHLHGGLVGFDKVLWRATPVMERGGGALRLEYTSRDGEEGYPGKLQVKVTYRLTAQDELRIEMSAQCDRATPVNLTHHSYWNLARHNGGSVSDHELQLFATHYTPLTVQKIPVGHKAAVALTPFDFTELKPIGDDIVRLPVRETDPGGFDVSYVINGQPGELRPAARLRDPKTGRVMFLETDAPGLQFYSGNSLDAVSGKGGATYVKHGGLCLETQAFPDSIHHQGEEGWPSVVLRPGEVYRHTMVHTFLVEEPGPRAVASD